jgi:AGZA family xanthine/uracil permease-like MFS transporter
MDFGAIMTATCISAALGCFIMGFWANYPIALAPGMGLNFYFTFAIVLGQGIAWQTALGVVFIAGICLVVLTVSGFREKLLQVIPASLKMGIAAGIGLFITFIGFLQGGLVVPHPITLVHLGDLKSLPAVFTLLGLVLIAALMQRKIKGAILIGMVVLSLLAIPFGLVKYQGVVSMPPSLVPTWMQLDIASALNLGMLSIITVFIFVQLFDSAGTLVGIGQQAGFVKDDKLPRATRAFLPDSVATTFGALVGTSNVTCYIESSAGVAVGGRTGLASVVTGLLFLSALFFFPLAAMIGGGTQQEGHPTLYPITAPVLIIVGCLMMRSLVRIDWHQWDECLPAFLIVVGMPLSYSIADGMALGFIAYPLIKLLSGKAREVHGLLYLIAVLFIFRYAF